MAPRSRDRWLALGLVTGSLLFVFLVLEVAFRFTSRGGGKEGNEERLYTEYDPLLGWHKKAGARSTYRRREYVTEVVMNSRGLRDVERPCAPPPGTRRILALGDSFLEGYTVDQHEVVTSVLERSLRRAGCSYDVINGGTNAYSTDQEYLFYRTEGIRYDPRIVVLFFYYNDVVYNDRQMYFGAPKPIFEMGTGQLRLHRYPVRAPDGPSEEMDHGEEMTPAPTGSRFLAWMADRVRQGAPGVYQSLARLGLWKPIPKLPLRLELRVYERRHEPLIEESWAKTAAILTALSRDVRSEGAHLLVVGVPSRLEVDERTWALTRALYDATDITWNRRGVMERLSRVGAEAGFPVLDLTAPFQAAYGRGPRPYFNHDGHWTPRGHAVAAEEVERFLRGRRWLAPCGDGANVNAGS